jgi:cell division protease FtsH
MISNQIKQFPDKTYKELKDTLDARIDDQLQRRERQAKRMEAEILKKNPVNAAQMIEESFDAIASFGESSSCTIAEVFWDKNYYALEDFYEFNYEAITNFKNDHKALFEYFIKTVDSITTDITLDLSKSLIFIAGNLDNIFAGLTHHIDNDSINPDEFYEYSKQVNFNDVKNCLLQNFKPEQVSRLGTNHVIFPSFNNKMYKKLISNLNKRTLAKFKKQKIDITIDSSVDDFLLKYGAIPSQGARSILSSHEFVVDSNISELISLAILNRTKKAKLSVKNNMLVLEAKKEKVVKDISIIDTKVLTNYPEPLNSVISVHEAGHAIAVIALTGRYPHMIKVRSSDSDVGGYVKHGGDELPTKETMKLQLAIKMAGYAAEFLIHGPDNVSSGASSDIMSATATASMMVKLLGFGDGISANGFSMGRDNLVLNDVNRLDQEVDDMISESFTLACTVLEFYKKEHKMLTSALKKTITMKEEDIKKLLKM